MTLLLYELIWVQLTPERSTLNATAVLVTLILVQEAWRDGGGLFGGRGRGGREIVDGLELGARKRP